MPSYCLLRPSRWADVYACDRDVDNLARVGHVGSAGEPLGGAVLHQPQVIIGHSERGLNLDIRRQILGTRFVQPNPGDEYADYEGRRDIVKHVEAQA